MRAIVKPLLYFALSSIVLPCGAHAHGRPTAVNRIAFDPSDPDRVVLGTTFGLVASGDGGVSWRWMCAASFGVDPTREDPELVVAADGSIVLGTFGGAARVSAELCDATFPEAPVHDVFVVDVTSDPTDAAIVWGVISSGVAPERVVRSEDSGATWSEIAARTDEILLERIVIAPSDPSRVYVSGAIADAGARRAFVSRLSGSSFTDAEIPIVEGERFPHVLGVDPTNPDRVFVRMARASTDLAPERLMVSADGGMTFEPVLELPALRSFAISADGRTMWAGSANGGLWIARDGATVFEQIGDQRVLCLAVRGEELWLCLDQITEGFALGRSIDGGATIEDALQIDQVDELPVCERCSASAIVCPAWSADLASDYEIYFGSGDGGVTGLPRDASIPEECGGPPPPPPPPEEGCGCRAIGAGAGGAPWISFLALLCRARVRRSFRSTV